MGFKRVVIALISAFLALLLVQSFSAAQSPVNLQADINQLRSEISQLKAQVSAISRQGNRALSPARTPRPTGRETLSDRQLLDRLATLAIEAKERLNRLEGRVAKLEKQSR